MTAAWAQWDANPPSTWTNDANALAAFDALAYLLAHRPEEASDQGSMQKYASLESFKKTLEMRTGVGMPRANGRSRRNAVAFQPGGIS